MPTEKNGMNVGVASVPPQAPQGMSSRSSFLFGLITGVAGMSLIGLLVVGVMVLQNDTEKEKNTNTGTVAGQQAPTNTATAPAEPQGDFSAIRKVASDDHVRGPANAKVTLIEYSDIQCPYCKTIHATLLKVLEAYPKDVRWVFRNFPLESIHPNARPAANAAECVAQLSGNDAYWTFVDALYENQTSIGDTVYSEQAVKAGVNKAKFEECYTAKKFDSLIERDITEGTSAGVQGTPATFVGSTLVSGALPFEQFKAAIDAQLK